MKLATYVSISTLLAVGSIYHSYTIHEQFYPTVVYLTNNKLCILSLGNFGFCFALTIANLIITVFFSNVGDDETNDILLRAKYSVTEICIALTSFRNELTKTVVTLFVGLLFVKAFHWLAVLRMENFARGQQANNTLLSKIRLFSSLMFLLAVDAVSASILSYLLYQSQRFSVNVLFAFEFTILMASAFAQICKFVVILIDRRYEERWSRKPVIMFILEFLHDLTHLGLYSVFIWILTMNWGFPLHLLRELFLAFHNLRNRVVHFYNYSRIIKVLDTQFKTVSRQEIIDSDRDVVCVICFAEMESGKELPCKHVFHLNCLKRWFEQKQECPMCRTKIVAKKRGRDRGRGRGRDRDRERVRQRGRIENPAPERNRNNNNGNDGLRRNDADSPGAEEKEPFEFRTTALQRDPYAIPAKSDDVPMDSMAAYSAQGFHPPSSYPMSYPVQPSYDQYQYQQQYAWPHQPQSAAMPFANVHYHPPSSPMRNDAVGSHPMAAELEHLTRSTQRQIELYETYANHLRQALEHYIALQQRWRDEDDHAVEVQEEEQQEEEEKKDDDQ